jgi:hypothetical protein
MSRIRNTTVYSESYGVLQARRPSREPSVPGRLVASAMTGVDGWYVSNRAGGGLHLVYVADEAQARQWLGIFGEVLG